MGGGGGGACDAATRHHIYMHPASHLANPKPQSHEPSIGNTEPKA